MTGTAETRFCESCGHRLGDRRESPIRRGSVEIGRDPLCVTWRGRIVPLSRTEAEVFAAIAIKGKLPMAGVDDVIRRMGGNPSTRRMVMLRIRRKFDRIGARDPLQSTGHSGVQFQIEPDDGATATIAGIHGSREAA